MGGIHQFRGISTQVGQIIVLRFILKIRAGKSRVHWPILTSFLKQFKFKIKASAAEWRRPFWLLVLILTSTLFLSEDIAKKIMENKTECFVISSSEFPPTVNENIFLILRENLKFFTTFRESVKLNFAVNFYLNTSFFLNFDFFKFNIALNCFWKLYLQRFLSKYLKSTLNYFFACFTIMTIDGAERFVSRNFLIFLLCFTLSRKCSICKYSKWKKYYFSFSWNKLGTEITNVLN